MSETSAPAAPRTPTVYFIDDSATMREVIKIAFRRENINVITCHDAATALAQFEQTSPDAVISDVIMPDKDGYQVCQFIKEHPQLSRTPVILMSGVVNRTVAEKAIAVKADELVRKPFQPQELIARVKQLLNPQAAAPPANASPSSAARALSSVFAPSPVPAALRPTPPAAWPTAPPSAPRTLISAAPTSDSASRAETPPAIEIQKLRSELLRLEHLVKKLQAELDAERQYCNALEAHIKTLQESG